LLVRKLCGTKHAGTESAAAIIETCQSNVQATTLLVQQVLLGHLDVCQPDATLPSTTDAALRTIATEDLNAFHVGCADKRSDCVLLLASFWIGDLLLRHHGEECTEGTGCRPLLLAVDDVEVATITQNTPSFLPASIAADVWLTKAECTQCVLGHARKEACLLLIITEQHESLATNRLVRRDKHCCRSAGAANPA